MKLLKLVSRFILRYLLALTLLVVYAVLHTQITGNLVDEQERAVVGGLVFLWAFVSPFFYKGWV